jgi:hypothetical protein
MNVAGTQRQGWATTITRITHQRTLFSLALRANSLQLPVAVVAHQEALRVVRPDEDRTSHGRTSPVLINNEIVNTYHYSTNIEFPYFIGCFTGKPV